MKNNKLAIFVLALSLPWISCDNSDSKTENVSQVDTTAVTTTTSPVNTDDVYTDTTKNSEDKILITSFNNTKGTAEIIFNGEKIVLTQDTTASGVGAHNEHYTYTSWHGETELTKDGKVIFAAKEQE
jgi:membrane-bound inhibitor of C-type lysozyme